MIDSIKNIAIKFWGMNETHNYLIASRENHTYKVFNQNKETFDVIFIDGLHTADQVEIDISNALKFLNDQGYIVCHDMNPTSEAMQATPRRKATWTGDCWKAWVRIRSSNSKLNMFVVDTDFGCGIIKKGKQELLTAEDLTYTNLNNNRKEWLNLIPTKDFSSYVA